MKQKDITQTTRTTLLDAANSVVLAKGVNALTLDAVAAQAGVSKGGLLYHFPSKNKLIEGMVEQLIAEFDAMLETELAQSNDGWLCAYIRASFQPNPKLDMLGAALFAALANNPELLHPLQTHYAQWQEKAISAAPTPAIGTIIRMAIDGLWMADLLNFAPPSSTVRENMRDTLLQMEKKERL